MSEEPVWRIEVKVSGDQMRAVVVMAPPPEGVEPDISALEKALHDAGVTTGIDREALANALFFRKWGQTVVAAVGTPAVHGQDSSVRILFETSADERPPQELEDGRVDFKNRDLIHNVRAGAELAEWVPPVPGRDGVLVTGEPVKWKPGRELPLPAGKNVLLSDDRKKLIAGIDGQAIVTRQGQISVLPVYQVRGDVGMETGNIKFVGSVEVGGAVLAGFEIEADGNITVRGFVAADRLVAGGSIAVGKGIQGRGRGRIEAGGDVRASFIENAWVSAGGDVSVRDAIMHSTVYAKKRVLVQGGKGLIVGGLICSGEEVQARIIGSSLATPTEVQVGIDPELREQQTEVLRTLADKEAEATRVDQAIRLLKGKIDSREGIDPDKRDVLLKLLKHRIALGTEVDELRSKRDNLEDKVLKSRKGRVSCKIMYPGVRFLIGSSNLQITDEWYDAVVYLSDNGKAAISGK